MLPDKTLTTLVAVPTTAHESSSSGSNDGRNAKLIGGLVGSIGGTLFIGAMVVLFLFLRRRRSRVTNHSPDFVDDTLAEESNEKLGFRKLFGSKHGSTNVGGVAGYNDLERNGDPFTGNTGNGRDLDDDFAYRGVSNSNNLDSVFHGSGNNSGGNPSAPGSEPNTNHHSRMNSNGPGYPLGAMPEAEHSPDSFDEDFSPPRNNRFSGFEEDYDDLYFQEHTHAPLLTEESHSNNSRLRFFEEI